MMTGLAIGGTGVGAAAIGLGRGFTPMIGDSAEGSWWTGAAQLDTAAGAAWAARVGETFEIAGADGQGSFKLVAVEPVRSAGERPDDVARRSAFVVAFEGDEKLAGNAIYSVRHASGSLDIFFSLAIADSAVPRLEAVFN